jgi:tetratricopeptide (TPR) repeat protein
MRVKPPIRRAQSCLCLTAVLVLLGACGQSAPAPAANASALGGDAGVDADMATCSDIGGQTAPRLAACTAVVQSSAASAETRSRALNNHGVLLDGKGDNDGAIADYNAAIGINPQYAAAFYNRAQAWRRNGDAAKADADAAEAVRLDPNLAGR